MKKLWDFWTKPRGSRHWRVFILATGATGLIGIPLVTFFPDTIPYVWLWLVGIPSNSPVAPLFPTAFEPLMMEVVKYKPVLGVALVATAIFVYMEFINWYVFWWVLNWQRFEMVREHRWVRWGVKRFARAPYLTVLFFAVTPLPFWVARSLAVLHRLRFWRYLGVMAVGRFPRLYLYAWLGSQLRLPSLVLITLAVGTGVLVIAWRLIRRQPLLHDTVLDAPTDGPTAAPAPVSPPAPAD